MVMRVRLLSVLLTLLAVMVGAVLAGLVVLYAGFYNVAATEQHLRPTYWLLETGLRESVERNARDIVVPKLDDERLVTRGLTLFRTECVQCHGAPGVAPAAFALGLTPLPANLVHAARASPPAHLYWVVRYGIKMSGMPAWQFRYPDEDLWAVVAFMQQLPRLSPTEYAALVAADVKQGGRQPKQRGDPDGGRGDPARGKVALRQYACTTCHLIPGVVGEHAPVGPPLDRIATRRYLAGVVPNTPANMVRWLREPKEIDPLTAMPDLGVTEHDAIDMAAYLYTLR